MVHIKIAHEAPLSIMEAVRDRTDYDYALVHLFETHPNYFKFFKQSIGMGRTVILDNSIFELGEAFDTERYVHWIKELQPTEYIIPDVLEDAEASIKNVEQWMKKYSDLPGKKIAVVQGVRLHDFVYCYQKYVELGVDKIAFTFRGSLYEWSSCVYEIPDPSDRIKLYQWMLGRICILEQLLELGVIDKNKPHHLLGCSLPQEFSHYKGEKFSWIESLDTSSPVLLGMGYENYDSQGGISFKSKEMLFENIDVGIGRDTLAFETIMNNIRSFRDLIKKNRK